MLTIRGIYDGKSVKILPGEPVPVAHGELPVIITFLEAQPQPSSHGEPLDEESPEEIAADEARWDNLFAASAVKLDAMAGEARSKYMTGKTTSLTIDNAELKPGTDKPLSEKARRILASGVNSRDLVSDPSRLLSPKEAGKRLDVLRAEIGPIGVNVEELIEEGRRL